jgi:hypothetical protein
MIRSKNNQEISIVLYHGSKNIFDHFVKQKKIVSLRGDGIFFSDSWKYAKIFGNVIYTCNVKFVNPKIYSDSIEFSYDEIVFGGVDELYSNLIKLGHDGIIIKKSKVSVGKIFEAIKFDQSGIEILDVSNLSVK